MRSLFVFALLGTLPAFADSTVIGGTLLSTADANSIGVAIFGTNNVTFTGIFTTVFGDRNNALNFHAAANGRGPTVALFQTDLGLVGGYNPQSWTSTNFNYTYTFNSSDRTALLFNLNTGVFLAQSAGSFGIYQTYNAPVYGPTFGGGHDLWGGRDEMRSGYANGFSYGNQNLFGDAPFVPRYFSISSIEVFTVAPTGPTTAAPEPSAYMLSLAGLALLGARQRLRKSARPTGAAFPQSRT